MCTDAHVAETPAPCQVRGQICADAAVQLQQQIVEGHYQQSPSHDGYLRVRYALHEEWSDLPIA